MPISGEQGESAIDHAMIDDLKELRIAGKPDPVATLIAMFIESSIEAHEQMQNALTEKNHARVGEIAHKLKSMSANLGAMDLSKACWDLEHCEESDTGEIEARFQSFVRELRRAQLELEAISLE